MLDTIVLRIHNLEKYGKTVDVLKQIKKDAVLKGIRTNNKTESERIKDGGKEEKLQPQEVIGLLYLSSGRFLPLRYRGSLRVTSSHYNLVFDVNMERNFLEFNFSIPKYKWGTNLIQFIDYYNTSWYTTFALLKGFVKEFLRQKFFMEEIDLMDVEINRIDFCYNQFFPTREDALKYLEHQKLRMKRLTRSQREGTGSRDTSLMYITDRYSFKIYHKGSEFRKNDYKKLCAKNPKGYDLQKFVDVSDRILRYEMTFRNLMFNYLFRRMHYDRGSMAKRSQYRHLFRTLKIEPLKKGQELGNKHFMVKSMFDDWEKIREDNPDHWHLLYRGDKCLTFDRDMFEACYNYFWKMVNFFQIQNSVSIAELEKKIHSMNEGIAVRNTFKHKKDSMRNVKRMTFYAILSSTYSLHDFYKQGLIGKTQFYEIKKNLGKIGLSEYNPEIKTVKPSLGYQDYKALFMSYH